MAPPIQEGPCRDSERGLREHCHRESSRLLFSTPGLFALFAESLRYKTCRSNGTQGNKAAGLRNGSQRRLNADIVDIETALGNISI